MKYRSFGFVILGFIVVEVINDGLVLEIGDDNFFKFRFY